MTEREAARLQSSVAATRQQRLAALRLIGLALTGLMLLYLIRYLPSATYTLKAGARMSVFLLVVILGRPRSYLKDCQLWQRLFKPRPFPWRQLLLSLLAGLILLAALYLLARPLANLFKIDAVVREITARTGTTQRSMIGVVLYIPLINALAEEIFFRGLLTGELCRLLTQRSGSLISAALFALYHLTVFRGWFSLPLLILALAGLFMMGLILNRLLIRDGHIYRAWILHAVLNLTIFAFAMPFFPA